MTHVLTPYRMARIRRDAVAVSTREQAEVDFDLGVREGIEIAAVRFGCERLNTTTQTAILDQTNLFSLHAAATGLEADLADGPVDDQILASEIIAHAALQLSFQIEAATRGGSAVAMVWTMDPNTNFLELQGQPLLLARNPLFAAEALGASVEIVGAECDIWYRYVQLSRNELAALFVQRR